jgi:pyruvate ferredoxin oxidoreductase delta subunit
MNTNVKVNKKDEKSMDSNVSWKDITKAGTIYTPGNARLFKTGDWRSMKPVFLEDKCKQCMLCFLACPDSSIMLNEEGKVTGIDYDHCKGCGVCTNVCPFNAFDYIEESK